MMCDVYLNRLDTVASLSSIYQHQMTKEPAVGEVESSEVLPRIRAEKELSVYLNSGLNVHS